MRHSVIGNAAFEKMKKTQLKRSSLLRIILFIVSAMMILMVAFIAVLFSTMGRDMYVDYKTADLMPKAKIISQQVTRLYQENADRRTVARMIYSDEFSVADSSTYIIEAGCSPISTDDSESMEKCLPFILGCAERVMTGDSVTIPHSPVGLLVGAPIYNDGEAVIGAVVLVHRNASIEQKVNSIALTFGIIMFAALLLTLVPLIFAFRSVTKPISQISDTALRMAKGDLSARAEVKGSYEAQHLAESFNTLAGALQSNIEYLIIERNRLGAVLNGIGEGLIAVDRNCEITQYNSASVHMLSGNDGDALASLPAYAHVRELIGEALEKDEVISKLYNVHDKVLSVKVTPIHEDNDNLCGAVALVRDVTESERLEQTRRDYVANVSHELRTPLASIRSLADALNDGMVREESDRKRYYGYILKESIRLSSLIDDLLELSRLQSGGVAFSKARVELYEILYDVADRMNETAQQTGRSVRLLVPEDEYYAFTNSDRIEQVLVALTDNAIKHGEEGCSVDIRLGISEDDSSYLFTVSNPAAIDPSDLDHIFERFYKADRAHSSEGTGLGLAIVSEVLNLLGEHISVNYESGVISFTFTVKRDGRDAEHPLLGAAEQADSLKGPAGEE